MITSKQIEYYDKFKDDFEKINKYRKYKDILYIVKQ